MPKKDESATPKTQESSPENEAAKEGGNAPVIQAGGHADPPPESDAGLQKQLETALAERDANREQWLRAEAELDNFRKRMRKEADDLRRFQSLGLTRDLLPALDNLDRAITAAEGSGNVDDLIQGIRMVAQQFRDILARHAIEPIAARDQPFDPNLHEAVQQVPSADHPPMTVLEELETGYKLHDRVIRPSKVLVSSVPPSDESEGPGDKVSG